MLLLRCVRLVRSLPRARREWFCWATGAASRTKHLTHRLSAEGVFGVPVCVGSISVNQDIGLHHVVMLVAVPAEVGSSRSGWNIVVADVIVIGHEQVQVARYNATITNFSFHNIMSAVHLLNGGLAVVVETVILSPFRRQGCFIGSCHSGDVEFKFSTLLVYHVFQDLFAKVSVGIAFVGKVCHYPLVNFVYS